MEGVLWLLLSPLLRLLGLKSWLSFFFRLCLLFPFFVHNFDSLLIPRLCTLLHTVLTGLRAGRTDGVTIVDGFLQCCGGER